MVYQTLPMLKLTSDSDSHFSYMNLSKSSNTNRKSHMATPQYLHNHTPNAGLVHLTKGVNS